ncbi:putative glycolipid-binding domain-containing protein [Streptomyces sp. NPDC097981]|uniref:putative glycolipid-binding domain-containing protein n=1 Tax=Streptomyces sp. NPDC097981 TaxID=3155428 RepID=UPI0033221C35
MAVPELTATPSVQTYTPLGSHRVRYSSGSFRSDVEFDGAGLVLDHPGLATRLRDADS